MALALVLGIVAGGLTTVSGLGGGLLLVTALSLLWDPRAALATTALALFASNLHRVYLFRHQIDRPAARRLILGVFPGAVLGGLFAVGVPAVVLRGAILGVVGLALGRAVFGWRFVLPRAALGPAGIVVGFLTATAGGAAILVAPLSLSAGLEGDRYVATVALVAAALHVGRILGYGAGGLIDGATLATAAALAVALMTGNLLGRVVRARLAEPHRRRLEYGTLAVCAALSVAGVA